MQFWKKAVDGAFTLGKIGLIAGAVLGILGALGLAAFTTGTAYATYGVLGVIGAALGAGFVGALEGVVAGAALGAIGGAVWGAAEDIYHMASASAHAVSKAYEPAPQQQTGVAMPPQDLSDQQTATEQDTPASSRFQNSVNQSRQSKSPNAYRGF